MNTTRKLACTIPALLVFATMYGGIMTREAAQAQDIVDEGPEPEAKPAEPKGSLKARPKSDPETAQWLRNLGGARAQSLTVKPGALRNVTLHPDGDRFYYYRQDDAPKREDGNTPDPTYSLYTVGPEKSESRVAECGADLTPPLFLGDGRILFTVRRHDTNHDGKLNLLDDSVLMASNRDGGNLRAVAPSFGRPGDLPVAVWRDDREVLVVTPGEDDENGWIESLNLVTDQRERLVQGFNVELVLPDGRLLIERLQPGKSPDADMPRFNRWGEPVEDFEPPPPTPPSLLEHSDHAIFNPADATVTVLYSPSRHSRLVATGDGSFFGHQAPEPPSTSRNWYGTPPTTGNVRTRPASELLIVDDEAHRDTRRLSAKYDYVSLGWVPSRGLLAVEQGNLGARLLLFDRSLKSHRLADFGLYARNWQASRDGLTVGWLEVEDTDKNGKLEPWKDHSRPHFLRIE